MPRDRKPTTRPEWAKRLWNWLADGQYERLGTTAPEWSYTWRYWRQDAGIRLLCLRFGHKPVPDQCGNPEHDYCLYCTKPMPHAAPRPDAQ